MSFSILYKWVECDEVPPHPDFHLLYVFTRTRTLVFHPSHRASLFLKNLPASTLRENFNPSSALSAPVKFALWVYA